MAIKSDTMCRTSHPFRDFLLQPAATFMPGLVVFIGSGCDVQHVCGDK